VANQPSPSVAAAATSDWLADSPSTLKGVGPAVGKRLGELGVKRLVDLLFLLPLRYEDRTRITPIQQLQAGIGQQVEVRVLEARFMPHRRGALDCLVEDDSGQMRLRFFHWGGSLKKRLTPGTRVRAFAEVRIGYQGMPEMSHPKMDILSEDQAPPALAEHPEAVYPSSKGLGSAVVASLIGQVLPRLEADQARKAIELLPDQLRQQHQLGSLSEALLAIHRPPRQQDKGPPAAAVYRLAFEEMLAHQLSMRQLRARARRQPAPTLSDTTGLCQAFLEHLPFPLTAAQQRVWNELKRELELGHPMLRLVQGDVGCGKTVVAALAALLAVSCGHQALLMAPTELLAEQHLRTFQAWCEPFDVQIQWLSGSVRGKAREQALATIAGDADIIIGTHALLQDGVDYREPGLVIIDEQHRFGVDQRLTLRDKGRFGRRLPHQLVMTATPIPRTLAQTAFADLDVSVIDELPPGRTPVTTVAMSQQRRDTLISRLVTQLDEGRQAYWVCPLIEESDVLQSEAAEQTAEKLRIALPNYRIGLAHGRMHSRDKDQVMQAFKAGQLDVLVATTVIEVGVDVPNASVMVIENPERLGLAQLHQLRGRVGRGHAAGHCVLMYRPPLSESARQRLQVLRESNDGFVIAERDLEWRGAGELLGQRQTGQMRFRIADPTRDQALLPQLQEAADNLITEYPEAASALIDRWLGQATRFADA
jgi:ATP-dependent DNA helicase RecG